MTILDYPTETTDKRLRRLEKHLNVWRILAVIFALLSAFEWFVMGVMMRPQLLNDWLMSRH